MSTGARYYGKYRATVMNNVDPMLQGLLLSLRLSALTDLIFIVHEVSLLQ